MQYKNYKLPTRSKQQKLENILLIIFFITALIFHSGLYLNACFNLRHCVTQILFQHIIKRAHHKPIQISNCDPIVQLSFTCCKKMLRSYCHGRLNRFCVYVYIDNRLLLTSQDTLSHWSGAIRPSSLLIPGQLG